MNFTSYTRLKHVVTSLRNIYPDFNLSMLLVFIEIAQNDEGLTVTQVSKRTGLTQSSASRHCRGLTMHQSPTKKGLNLCEWRSCATDFRSKLLVLNTQGHELMGEIEQAMKL